jgi:hypothetical protein
VNCFLCYGCTCLEATSSLRSDCSVCIACYFVHVSFGHPIYYMHHAFPVALWPLPALRLRQPHLPCAFMAMSVLQCLCAACEGLHTASRLLVKRNVT